MPLGRLGVVVAKPGRRFGTPLPTVLASGHPGSEPRNRGPEVLLPAITSPLAGRWVAGKAVGTL